MWSWLMMYLLSTADECELHWWMKLEMMIFLLGGEDYNSWILCELLLTEECFCCSTLTIMSKWLTVFIRKGLFIHYVDRIDRLSRPSVLMIYHWWWRRILAVKVELKLMVMEPNIAMMLIVAIRPERLSCWGRLVITSGFWGLQRSSMFWKVIEVLHMYIKYEWNGRLLWL